MNATATKTVAKKSETKKLRGALLAAMKTQLGKYMTLGKLFEAVEKDIPKADAVESYNRGWGDAEEKIALWEKIQKGKVRLIKRAFSDMIYRSENADRYPDHPVVRAEGKNKDAKDFDKKFMLVKLPKRKKVPA